MADELSWNIIINNMNIIITNIITGSIAFFIARYTLRTRSKEKLKQEVYRNLYNGISQLQKSKFYSRFFQFNAWNQLDDYSKFNVERKLRELLNQYSNEIKKYEKIIRQKIDDFVAQKAVLEPILKTPFQKSNLINNSEEVIRHRNNTNSILDWLIDYSSVFFSSKVTDSQTLYKMLEERASKADDGYLDSIQKWKDEKPTLYSSIFEQLSELKKNFHANYSEEDLEKQRQILVKLTDELITELEKKIK